MTLSGPVTLSTDLKAMLPFATQIAARYMGPELSEQYGRGNAVDGELLVRMRIEHVIALRDIAA